MSDARSDRPDHRHRALRAGGPGGAAGRGASTRPTARPTVTSASLDGVPVLHVPRHGAGPRPAVAPGHAAGQRGGHRRRGRAWRWCRPRCAGRSTRRWSSASSWSSTTSTSRPTAWPDGSLCTLFTGPDIPGRGHWIYELPFGERVRAGLVAGAAAAGLAVRDGGTYGHVDGPRLNTVSEIAQLAAAGVTAVSQTGGPETVLAGEAGLPFALVGFVTDHANGVMPEATPAETLARLFGESAGRVPEGAARGAAASSPPTRASRRGSSSRSDPAAARPRARGRR